MNHDEALAFLNPSQASQLGTSYQQESSSPDEKGIQLAPQSRATGMSQEDALAFLGVNQQQKSATPDSAYLTSPIPAAQLPQSDPNDLTSNYTQSVPQATPQATPQAPQASQGMSKEDALTFLGASQPEQTGKTINIPATPQPSAEAPYDWKGAAIAAGSTAVEQGAGLLAGPTVAKAITSAVPIPIVGPALGMAGMIGVQQATEYGVKKLEELAGYRQQIEQAQQEHPTVSTVTGYATMAPFAITSLKNIGADFAKTLSTNGATAAAKQLAGKLVGGTIGGSLLGPIRYGLENLEYATGIKKEKPTPITAREELENGIIGLILSGHAEAKKTNKDLGGPAPKVSPSANPSVNEKEAAINASADAQAPIPEAPKPVETAPIAPTAPAKDLTSLLTEQIFHEEGSEKWNEYQQQIDALTKPAEAPIAEAQPTEENALETRKVEEGNKPEYPNGNETRQATETGGGNRPVTSKEEPQKEVVLTDEQQAEKVLLDKIDAEAGNPKPPKPEAPETNPYTEVLRRYESGEEDSINTPQELVAEISKVARKQRNQYLKDAIDRFHDAMDVGADVEPEVEKLINEVKIEEQRHGAKAEEKAPKSNAPKDKAQEVFGEGANGLSYVLENKILDPATYRKLVKSGVIEKGGSNYDFFYKNKFPKEVRDLIFSRDGLLIDKVSDAIGKSPYELLEQIQEAYETAKKIKEETKAREAQQKALEEQAKKMAALKKSNPLAYERIAEEEARKLLNGQLRGEGAFFEFPDFVKDAAIKVGDAVRKGATSFKDWSNGMISRLGEGVRDFLKDIWASVRDNWNKDIGGGFDTGGRSREQAQREAEAKRDIVKEIEEAKKRVADLEKNISQYQKKKFVPQEERIKASRGKETLLKRISAEEAFGRITTHEAEAMRQFVNTLHDDYLSDVALSIRQKSSKDAQGFFNFADGIITLVRSAIEKGPNGFDETFLHELWHSLSRFVPEEDLQKVSKQYLKEQNEYVQKNPWFKALIGRDTLNEDQYNDWRKFVDKETAEKYTNLIVDNNGKPVLKNGKKQYQIKFNNENYRFRDIDEWFAETMKDKSMSSYYDMDEPVKNILGYAKKVYTSILEAIKNIFSPKIADEIYKKITSGESSYKQRTDALGYNGSENEMVKFSKKESEPTQEESAKYAPKPPTDREAFAKRAADALLKGRGTPITEDEMQNILSQKFPGITSREASDLYAGATGKEKPPAPYAGVASEGQGEKISIKNASAEAEAKALGLPELTQQDEQEMTAAMDRAKATSAEDPLAGQRLAESLIADPRRSLTGDESALLLKHKTDLFNSLNKMAEGLTEGSPEQRFEKGLAYDNASKAYHDLLQAIKDRGSEWGREGRWRQALLHQDYTFATQERLATAAKRKPLTSNEKTKLAEETKRLTEIDKEIAERQEKEANKQEQKKAEQEIKNAPQVDPYIQSLVDRVRRNVSTAADAARERIRQRRAEGRLFTGVDPTEIADYAIIGADHLLEGTTKFADWSSKMIGEFGDKIKPYLNDIFNKSKEYNEQQVDKESKGSKSVKKRVAKAVSPEERIRKGQETRARNRLEQLKQEEERQKNGDFSKPEKKAPIEPSEETKKLRIEAQKIKDRIDKRRADFEKANRPAVNKVLDAISALNRFNILSHVTVLEHLAGAAVENIVTRPVSSTLAQLFRFNKTLDSIRRKAVYEGGLSAKSELKGVYGIITSAKDVWSKLIKGKADIDWLYGGKNNYDPAFVRMVENVHGAMKEPVRQGIFSRSLQLRIDAAEKMGLDPTHDEVLYKTLASEAVNDANMDIFMGDNFITRGIRGLMKGFETNKQSPRLGKFVSALMDIAMPVMNVPTNIAIRKMRLIGGLLEAGTRIGIAAKEGKLANGSETLTNQEAEQIMRAFKYGTLGIALGAYAWKNANQFGGIVNNVGPNAPENKDLKKGEMELGGIKIARPLGHGPVATYMNMVADARRMYDKSVRNNPNSKWSSLSEPAFFSMFVSGLGSLPPAQAATRFFSPYTTAGQKIGQTLRDMIIPGAVQDVAAKMDTESQPKNFIDMIEAEPIKRSPKTFGQEMMKGLPGLRSKLPTSKPRGSHSGRKASSNPFGGF